MTKFEDIADLMEEAGFEARSLEEPDIAALVKIFREEAKTK